MTEEKPDNRKPMARSREKKRKAGLAPVEVWVHKTRKQEIREAASRMQSPIEKAGGDS